MYTIKPRKYYKLSTGDNIIFDYTWDILNECIGANVAQWGRGAYPQGSYLTTTSKQFPFIFFWFPKLSIINSDKKTSSSSIWINYLSGKSRIIEECIDQANKDYFFDEKKHNGNVLRITFVRDPVTKKYYFAGVFKSNNNLTRNNYHVFDKVFDKIEFPQSISDEFNISFNNYLAQETIEEAKLITEIDSIRDSELTCFKSTKAKAKDPQFIDGRKVYIRDSRVSSDALRKANYTCEINPEGHKSFIRKSNGKRYTEPHHLIPISCQDKFEYSLDVPANIVSLCSECHNTIHYGVDQGKMLSILFQDRKDRLKEAGLEITLYELLDFYL